MANKNNKEEDRRFHIELAKQMLTLATAAFGLVAALAWNSFIQEFVATYVDKWLPELGKLMSLGIYAVIVTILAVVVTWQLSKVVKNLEEN